MVKLKLNCTLPNGNQHKLDPTFTIKRVSCILLT